MRIIAYEKIGDDAELQKADGIIMDEESYQQIDRFSSPTKIVISLDDEFLAPDCYIQRHYGDAIRIVDSTGLKIVLVVGPTLHDLAIHDLAIALGAEEGQTLSL